MQGRHGIHVKKLPRPLVIIALVYLAASLGHFVHNAEFIDEYPNLPGWLTRGVVYGAWFVTQIPCLLALLAWARGRTVLALGLFAAWSALGYLGLDHYHVAPVSSHTAVANFTIQFEVLSGTVLLTASLVYLFKCKTFSG